MRSWACFFCDYGLNPAYRPAIERAGLRVTGLGEEGEARTTSQLTDTIRELGRPDRSGISRAVP